LSQITPSDYAEIPGMRQSLDLRPQPRLSLWQEHLTFEELQMGLESFLGFSLPHFLLGRSKFLREMGIWLADFDEKQPHRFINAVPPNPRECLILPTPAQELWIAWNASSGRMPSDSEIYEMAGRFGLPRRVLGQPSSTLSGGESVLLALAKLATYADSEESALVCTPTQWLHHTNFSKLFDLETLYGSGNVDWLVMEGETLEAAPLGGQAQKDPFGTPLEWFLEVEDPVVEFAASQFPNESRAFCLHYSLGEKDLGALPSPTLLTGENGVGKTVFANLLSGVIRPSSGATATKAQGRQTRARILMQDSQKQFIGDRVRTHLGRSLASDGKVRDRAQALAEGILNSLAKELAQEASTVGVVVTTEDSATFIESKVILTAERLASRPALLVLDEPGWCLSRSVARAFVSIVIELAHAQGTAVLMISHLRSWWTGLFASELRFERKEESTTGKSVVGIEMVKS